MVLHASEEAVQEGCEDQGDRGDGDDGECGPQDEGVPLPQPELADEGEGCGACAVEELVGGERHGLGVEETGAEADEGDDQRQLQGIGDVVRELRGGDVEAEDEGDGEADDGGGAEQGIDADEESDGEAPGEFLW